MSTGVKRKQSVEEKYKVNKIFKKEPSSTYVLTSDEEIDTTRKALRPKRKIPKSSYVDDNDFSSDDQSNNKSLKLIKNEIDSSYSDSESEVSKPKRKLATKFKKNNTADKNPVPLKKSDPKKKNIKKEIKYETEPKKPKSKELTKKEISETKQELLFPDDDFDTKIRKTRWSLSTTVIEPLWKEHELLQYQQDLNECVAKNIVKLFEDKNTIPFIARYRRNETGNMTPEDLRETKDNLDKIQTLKAKIQTVYKNVEKSGKMDDVLGMSILSARNMETLEHLYAPYKPENVRSLAQRAKLAGLEDVAESIILEKRYENLESYVNSNIVGLESVDKVKIGIMHIISQKIATDPDTLASIHKLKSEIYFLLETKKLQKRIKKDEKEKDLKKPLKKITTDADESKFSLYFDFKSRINYLKPHQILAINRGEHLKVLSVKIIVPDFFYNKFQHFCISKWVASTLGLSIERNKIMNEAIEDTYTRIICPLVKRELRAELKSKAEKASIEVFSGNLKQLLLGAPLRNKCILGIDPGFAHGCKLAIISEMGSVLATEVVYPHKKNHSIIQYETLIKNMLSIFNCSIIALGNGTACRETESWISDMISRNLFKPLDVTYTIVNENGASIYSCGAEAKKEFPNMDPNIISAVSLARRIQEPLAELVKIEPKHLGIGMYQHDLPAKRLEEALNDVVSECVSFVGVDLNTASQCLLKHIAGLTDRRATEIINYREKHGPFASREDIKKVKGIGEHSFKQCAGFLRIRSVTTVKQNVLDDTIIHPESYKVSEKLIKHLKLKLNDIGTDPFMATIKKEENNVINSYATFDPSVENVRLIIEGLSKPLNHDIRSECDIKPLFKKGLTNTEDLCVGVELTGRVENVTHFGCFVDVGVGINGLIHSSKMRGCNLQIGDRVEVNILELDLTRKRIGLQFIKKI